MKLRHLLIVPIIIIAVALPLITSTSALANPSENFYKEDGEIFDDWDICRTRGTQHDGFFQFLSESDFRPVIAFESLGDNAGNAYQLGQGFIANYPDLNQRAEQIFNYARNKIRYSSDEEQFGFPEFAQNADEVIETITQKGLTYGDCEDYAVLLAIMFKGAGLRSAIALVPGHAAALVYLPENKRANRIISLDGESGWIWAEATGGKNRLGWMPEQFIVDPVIAYEVTVEAITAPEQPGKLPTVVTQKGGSRGIPIFPFFGILLFMFLIPLFRRQTFVSMK
jgi:hypothetical protein